jgi:hypothetical protein
MTGIPPELETELSVHLLGYVLTRTDNSGQRLQKQTAQMDTAVRAAQKEARRKTAERKKKPQEKNTGEGKPAGPTIETLRIERPTPRRNRRATRPKSDKVGVSCRRAFMPCLMLIVVLAFPRIALVLLFLFSNYLQRAYHGLILPLVGFLFLPLTTLAYAWMANTGRPTTGVNLVVLIIAVVIDLGGLGGSYHQRRG